MFLLNGNYNKLPTRLVSKNKNTSKFNSDNIKLITDPYGYTTDDTYEVYNSKFQFSDFYNKDVQPHSWISKPKFLLDSKGGEFYSHTPQGLELAYRHLMSMYQDLDTNLQRLYDGYHDSCFIRFAFRAGVFTTEQHWLFLLRNWYRGFSMALRRYYNACHPKFDASTNMSYTSYFDTHFSNYLYYGLGRSDQDNVNLKTGINSKDVEIIRLDQIEKSNTDFRVTYDLSY